MNMDQRLGGVHRPQSASEEGDLNKRLKQSQPVSGGRLEPHDITHQIPAAIESYGDTNQPAAGSTNSTSTLSEEKALREALAQRLGGIKKPHPVHSQARTSSKEVLRSTDKVSWLTTWFESLAVFCY
jgi:uncharacterized protein (DUF1800 family)